MNDKTTFVDLLQKLLEQNVQVCIVPLADNGTFSFRVSVDDPNDNSQCTTGTGYLTFLEADTFVGGKDWLFKQALEKLVHKLNQHLKNKIRL